MPSAFRKIKRYLILSPHLSQAIACAKRLIKNKEFIVTGAYLPNEDPSLFPHLSKYYHDIIVIDSLDELICDYECIIPTGASSIKFIFDSKDHHQCGTIRIDKNILNSSDKLAILSLAETLGINVPTTWPQFEDIPSGEIAIFYKPKYEGLPGDRTWVKSRDEIPTFIQNGNFLFQEKIDSPGVYGYGFIADKGNILTSFMHHEIISYPVDGGSAAVIRPYTNKSLHEYSSRLIKAMSYTGYGLVEFKWCPRREDFVLMEINAKLWASIELAFSLNVDFSQLILSTQTSPTCVNGLIWPDRLFRCGPRSIWLARKHLLEYHYVFEAVSISRIANKIKRSLLNVGK